MVQGSRDRLADLVVLKARRDPKVLGHRYSLGIRGRQARLKWEPLYSDRHVTDKTNQLRNE